LDQLLVYAQKVWAFLTVSENAGAIQTIIAVSVIAWAIIKNPWNWFQKGKELAIPTTSTEHPIITLTLPQFEERIAKEISESEANLKTAHDTEKIQLLQKIEELRNRAAHPEEALQEARETITKLEDVLTREGNDIGEASMTEARKALEAGDFSIADDIFAEIEAREQLAVERAARAAFARGEIAQQEIRWTDAAKHYARAAQLHPTFEHLYSAREFAWRNGDYTKSIPLGTDLLEIAKVEFGETHEKYALALNEHALTLKATGKYDLAEPLYKQAIEITKQTLGENHPDYATRLNNLADLYLATGQYDLAEPLFKQAIEIFKQTLGENHPKYATSLNNLAELYRATGQYDLAESFFKQAIEILEASLGLDHPNTKTVKDNYKNFFENHP